MFSTNKEMNKLILASILAGITTITGFPQKVLADYWLVIGSYRQGPGSKPHVSGITSPTLFAIPMDTKTLCMAAGKKIEDEIYKPVWQFDNKWTCIFSGEK